MNIESLERKKFSEGCVKKNRRKIADKEIL